MFKTFLVVHIISGSLGLLSGPIAMLTDKGGKAHRLWGKIFFASMSMVFVTAIFMSLIRFNPFLFMVAVFSYYLAVSGYRSLFRKRVKSFADVAAIDWIIISVAGMFHLALVIYAVYGIVAAADPVFPWIALVFGIIGCNAVRAELVSFYKAPVDKMKWLYNHISGMLGAYIAAVTAFSAVNLIFIPGIIRWLWPTIIGTPLIIAWIRYYRRKGLKSRAHKLESDNV